MDIDFSRLAILLNKCLDNYTIYTERNNGEKYLSEHCRQLKFTLRSFCFFCKDFNFIMINYKFTIHDKLLFAFLYFE